MHIWRRRTGLSATRFKGVCTSGRVDVWVNNAAVTLFGRFEETPPDAYRRVIETNLFGYIHGARAALPHFREQGSGVLINVASVAGRVGQPYTSAYVTSKFAILGLSECLRQELHDAADVHVCTVLPASIDTPLFQHAANYTGRAVKPLGPVYDVERAAEAIVRLVESPRREVIVGHAGRGLLLLRMLAPASGERFMAKRVEQDHFQERAAEPNPGNVFEPMPQYTDIRGGWKPPRTTSALGFAAVGLTVLGLGLVAWWRAGQV
jgi:short-subunit dehydrogenase